MPPDLTCPGAIIGPVWGAQALIRAFCEGVMGFSWELKQSGGVVPAIWCDGCIEPIVTSDALTVCSLDVEGDEEDSDYQIVSIVAADVLIVCGQECLERVGGSSDRAMTLNPMTSLNQPHITTRGASAQGLSGMVVSPPSAPSRSGERCFGGHEGRSSPSGPVLAMTPRLGQPHGPTGRFLSALKIFLGSLVGSRRIVDGRGRSSIRDDTGSLLGDGMDRMLAACLVVM